jgi:outer membrane protein OmpA-like peptidoglycan-associated protein
MYKYLFMAMLLFGKVTIAQDFLGLQSSNYAGVTGIYSNPANIADNRFVVDVALIGFHFNFDNNFVGIKRSALKYTGKLTDPETLELTEPSWNNSDFNNPESFRKNLLLINNGKSKSFALSNRLVLPSFMINLNKRNSIALSWSIRNYFNIDGISQELANLAYSDFSNIDYMNTRLKNKNLNIQQMSWAEYGFTYARVLKLEGKNFFKAGFTAKYLQGLEATYVYVRDLTYEFNKRDSALFFNSSVAYGHSDNLDLDGDDFAQIPNYGGFGFDLGAVYEWRPDVEKFRYNMDGKKDLWRKDKNKYKLKASLAINDIGRIRFTKGALSGDFNANANVSFKRFDDVDDLNSFDSTLNVVFTNKQSSGTFDMVLPTAINAQFDYHLWKTFYLNFTANLANMSKRREAKVHDYTTLSLAPRFDHKWFGVTVPLSYNTLAGQRGDYVSLGAMVRLGPLVIGSNDLLSFVSSDVFGANFYFLLKVPIPYGHYRDKDKDQVSNGNDLCRDVPGVWEFKGCPDRDQDHVEDKEDKCPDVPGLKELQGCPDRDSDGITDAEDDCPDNAGTPEFKGCPDRDGDKVIDRQDTCPDIAGTMEFNGCPDTDSDGTQDKEDSCPDVFGPKELKGCPDKDADGILDKDDGCPEVAGPLENKGCPWPDTDKDGILDKDDNCPQVPGEVLYKGCPKPPDPIAQEVPMKAAEKKIIERAFASLEFATAKDIIKPKSFSGLNSLATLMKQHEADWKLKLIGHTDNEGEEEKNLVLSEKRAKAVKKYLIKKGVKEENILTEWYGETMPIDDNATPKGRQKNRRVEMKIMLTE